MLRHLLAIGCLVSLGMSPLVAQTLTVPFPTSRSINEGWEYKQIPVRHEGIDFQAPIGTNVVAAEDGWAISSCQPPGYGTFILIQHSNGYSTLYAHLSAVTLPAVATLPCDDQSRYSITGIGSIQYGGRQYSRQWVTQGTVIGRTGNTGNVQGPHLHFEVARNTDASYASAVTSANRQDPYAIKKAVASYPPPIENCGNRQPSLVYHWSACPPIPNQAQSSLTMVVQISSTTLRLDGSAVNISGTVTNHTSTSQNNVSLQAWIAQGGITIAAGGSLLVPDGWSGNTLLLGAVPSLATLTLDSRYHQANAGFAIGAGMVSGPAVLTVELRQVVGGAAVVVDTRAFSVNLQ